MEQVIGTLSGVAGHTFDIEYDLFFTGERLIAYNVKHPADVPPRFSWQAIFIGGSGEVRRERLELQEISRVRRQKAKGLTLDQMVAASNRNFCLRYAEINSAEVIRRFFQWQLRFYLSEPSERKRMVRFYLNKKQVAEAERLLKTIKH